MKKPTIYDIKSEAMVATHRKTDYTRTEIRESIDNLNKAENELFLAVLASLIPGVESNLAKAKSNVDEHFGIVYGTPEKRSRTLVCKIENAFKNHGLSCADISR